MTECENFDPNKDYTFNKVNFEKCIKELEEEYNKVLQEKGFVTTLEMAKLFDHIVCGMSEEDIRLKYFYFDYFGIG